ncbi:uncharacterized protein LOC119553363 [Drosophila subpulchrella]|uniref:uncharacterized protein LOC119553363 n=1 Tax=Drosophila subpulchrella TaxID=1486046 RepID=UPI0018A1A229|nr:uncharacterized protein LOC119553363 [Drosophila subpulchrella]
MNLLQCFVLFFLGLVLSGVDAQQVTRPVTDRDKACGEGRYYNYARNSCWPAPGSLVNG